MNLLYKIHATKQTYNYETIALRISIWSNNYIAAAGASVKAKLI